MKVFLLLALLLGSSPAWAQQPDPLYYTTRHALPTPGTAPIEAQIQRIERARPTTTVRRYGRVSTYSWIQTATQWQLNSVNTYQYDTEGRARVILITDSVTQTPISRVSYTYSSTGQLANYVGELWQSAGWQNSYRLLATYDAQNNPAEFVDQEWRGGTWQNTNRSLFTFDAQNRQTQVLDQEWTANAWATIGGYQQAYVLDAAGRLTEETNDYWNATIAAFEPNVRYLYSYTGSSPLYTGYDMQAWRNGSWANNLRYSSFTYTPQQQPGFYEIQQWSGAAWQLNNRITYTYPASGLGYSYISEILLNGTWQNQARYSLRYDSQNAFLGGLTELWQNNAWVYNSGVLYTVGYDANNDLTRRLTQLVQPNTGSLRNIGKSFYSNYQSIALSNTASAPALTAHLYPNPASGSTTLELSGLLKTSEAEVSIINALGQTLYRTVCRVQPGTTRQVLDCAALPAGVYTVRAATPAATVVKRLVCK